MPNVPRDPRQLARDILAGKISIEELAREQQRRRGGPMPASRSNQPAARVPLPRVPPPVGSPRPVARPQPMPQRQNQPQRPAQPPRQQPSRPRPMPGSTGSRPNQVLLPMPVQTRVESSVTSIQRNAEGPKPLISAKAPALVRPAAARIFETRGALRQGIIMAEILGKPVGLRDEF